MQTIQSSSRCGSHSATVLQVLSSHSTTALQVLSSHSITALQVLSTANCQIRNKIWGDTVKPHIGGIPAVMRWRERDVIRDTGNSRVMAIYLCADGLQLIMRRSRLETSHAVLYGNAAESREDKQTGIQRTRTNRSLSNTRRKRLVKAGRSVNSVYSLFIFFWPCISLQILANNQLDALFHVFIYFISLHVSSIAVLIIRR